MGKLSLFLVLARIAHQGSRLSAVRWAHEHAVAEVLGLPGFDEDDLYAALDDLCARQARTGTGTGTTGGGSAGTGGETGKGTGDGGTKPKTPVLRRFHGSAKIDATRLSRDVDLIASSVVQHLAGLLDAKVTITLEIEAEIPSGAPDNVVRTVTENCRTLKFDSQGFEES
jgi:hypothetical protein